VTARARDGFPVDHKLATTIRAYPQMKQMQLFTQANRLAFTDRAKYLGDPDFIDVPVAGLTDPAYIASRAKLISMAG
jgi:gamma-glutamyltranspeptidase